MKLINILCKLAYHPIFKTVIEKTSRAEVLAIALLFLIRLLIYKEYFKVA